MVEGRKGAQGVVHVESTSSRAEQSGNWLRAGRDRVVVFGVGVNDSSRE